MPKARVLFSTELLLPPNLCPQQLHHSCNYLMPEPSPIKSTNPNYVPLKDDAFLTLRGLEEARTRHGLGFTHPRKSHEHGKIRDEKANIYQYARTRFWKGETDVKSKKWMKKQRVEDGKGMWRGRTDDYGAATLREEDGHLEGSLEGWTRVEIDVPSSAGNKVESVEGFWGYATATGANEAIDPLGIRTLRVSRISHTSNRGRWSIPTLHYLLLNNIKTNKKIFVRKF